jgi:polar amino acid transport system substrate-binding protein
MKNNRFSNPFFLFILLFMLCVVSSGNAMELTFACENKQDFPSVMGNGDAVSATKPGMSIEAIRQLEKKLNIKILIKRMPWKRCLKELEQGRIDGLFTASYKDERKQHGVYPEKDGKVDPDRRISSVAYAFYKLKGSDFGYNGTNCTNVSGNIGAPMGYSIVDDLKKKGLKIDESPGTDKDFIKLIKGRIQAFAALEMTGDFYIDSTPEFAEKVEKVTPLIATKPYYFMLSHQFYNANKEVGEKIFDTIKIIREDKDYKNKLKDYL